MTIGLVYLVGQCPCGERYALGPGGQVYGYDSLEQIAVVAPPFGCPFHSTDLKILSVFAAPTKDGRWLFLDRTLRRETVKAQ